MNLIDESHPEAATLRKIRADIASLSEQAAAVTSAALPLEDAVQQLEEMLRLRYDPLRALERAAYPSTAGEHRAVEITADLVFALIRDELLERARARLEAMHLESRGLPIADRAAELERLARKRQKLEEAEEREILRLEAAGHYITRRPDIDVRLVAQIWEQEL